MLLAFVLCAGLVMTSCETADPVGNDKDPDNSENTGDTGNTGNTGDNNSSSDIIVFADDIVKKSCVDVFDTDGDGEISYGEAAAVKDLSNVSLRFLKDFLTFDEFQYFINVKSIPDKFFRGCKYLKSIMLPKSLNEIGEDAFYGCTGLTTIEFPEGLETIGKCAFSGCTGLTEVVFPERLETIGESAFDGCTSLTKIEFPEGLETIGGHAFWQCTGLTEVVFPEGLETIGEYAFWECDGLTKIFSKPMTPPTCEDIILPFGLQKLRIYVPRESVNLYKNASSWNYYSDNIVGYDF